MATDPSCSCHNVPAHPCSGDCCQIATRWRCIPCHHQSSKLSMGCHDGPMPAPCRPEVLQGAHQMVPHSVYHGWESMEREWRNGHEWTGNVHEHSGVHVFTGCWPHFTPTRPTSFWRKHKEGISNRTYTLIIFNTFLSFFRLLCSVWRMRSWSQDSRPFLAAEWRMFHYPVPKRARGIEIEWNI